MQLGGVAHHPPIVGDHGQKPHRLRGCLGGLPMQDLRLPLGPTCGLQKGGDCAKPPVGLPPTCCFLSPNASSHAQVITGYSSHSNLPVACRRGVIVQRPQLGSRPSTMLQRKCLSCPHLSQQQCPHLPQQCKPTCGLQRGGDYVKLPAGLPSINMCLLQCKCLSCPHLPQQCKPTCGLQRGGDYVKPPAGLPPTGTPGLSPRTL